MGYSPIGTVGSYPGTYAGGTSVAVNTDVGSAYVDINPFDGNLYITAQTLTPTGGAAPTVLATDMYVTSGTPVSGAAAWTALHIGASLQQPRGFVFATASTLFVADAAVGVRRFLNSGGTWVADPVTYVATAADPNVTQVALGADGVTLFAVTGTSVYALNITTLQWLRGGAAVAVAAARTQFRGIALAPYVPMPPPPAVTNTTVFVAENSPAGTAVGPALGAGLPPVPQVSWQILSGATNASGNGYVGATAFQISACSGQISVATPLLDFETTPVYVLSVRAYIDDATYPVPPQTFITVTVRVQGAM